MKFPTIALVLACVAKASNAQCLTTFTVDADVCSFDALIESLQKLLDDTAATTMVPCGNDALKELQLSLNIKSEEGIKEAVFEACSKAYVPFEEITNQGHVFDKEYYDGGTYYNEERQSINEYGITNHRLKDDPGSRMRDINENVAQSNGITWPDNLANFEDCKLNAAMCCFVQDRQAGDKNGNCEEPYNEDCLDANPADNTDICYVDMSRAPTSSRTTAGFALFEGEDEDDSHCHGIAWAEDPTHQSARFKANNLFHVSMYDHLTQRGYVRNVPGAPMCACVEQMAVVTRSDCTQIDIISEDVTFTYSADDGLCANITNLDIDFNSCEGANGNNNDLAAYYEQMVIDGNISEEKKERFDEIVVGKTYCREAIDKFLVGEGLIAQPACRYADPQECGCGEEVLQKDYRGDINTTGIKSGEIPCQRWDEQSPHKHSRTRKNYPDSNLVENYCRNPDNEPNGAWCYTTDPDVRWRYCDVPVCGKEDSVTRKLLRGE